MMFHGFAKRIEELEKQISCWELKAKKEDKWKKCMENWLLKNFDFDIQDDVSKLSDGDEPEEEERKSDYSQAYEEPVVNSSYNNFQIAPYKQVYNNPHLIIESQSAEEHNGLQQKQGSTRTRNHKVRDREDEYQHLSELQPAHLNSQPHGILQLSYENSSRSNIVGSTKERPEPLHKRKAERKSSSPSSSCLTTPVSLQKVDSVNEYSSSKMRLSHSHDHVGSNITLTPLPLTSSSTVNSESDGFGIGRIKSSSPHQNNKTSAHNNHANIIGHNVTSLINTSISHPLKEEDNEEEEWHEENDDCALPHYSTGQLEICRPNMSNEESSEITSMSEDIEEISNDVEDHHSVDNITLPGVLSSGDISIFKGGTNFFSNPKNLPICNFCGKSYSSQTYLKTHIDVVHKGMKAYRCKLCGVSFGFKSDLTRHLRSHLKRKTSVV